MDYFILTDTEFFRQITDEKDNCKLANAYGDFIKAVFDLCTGSVSRYELLFAMTYTETELQSLYETYRLNIDINKESDSCFLYTRKALSFIRHTLKHMKTKVLTPTSDNINQPSIAPYSWTGSTVELN
jgi:hypothetical protein